MYSPALQTGCARTQRYECEPAFVSMLLLAVSRRWGCGRFLRGLPLGSKPRPNNHQLRPMVGWTLCSGFGPVQEGRYAYTGASLPATSAVVAYNEAAEPESKERCRMRTPPGRLRDLYHESGRPVGEKETHLKDLVVVPSRILFCQQDVRRVNKTREGKRQAWLTTV